MTSLPTTAPAPKRYRVFLLEKLHYTVDVLADSEDDARDLALESECRSDAECTFFDAEEIAIVPDDDKTFLPSNGCYRCGVRMADENYPHCPACRENTKPESRASPTSATSDQGRLL